MGSFFFPRADLPAMSVHGLLAVCPSLAFWENLPACFLVPPPALTTHYHIHLLLTMIPPPPSTHSIHHYTITTHHGGHTQPYNYPIQFKVCYKIIIECASLSIANMSPTLNFYLHWYWAVGSRCFTDLTLVLTCPSLLTVLFIMCSPPFSISPIISHYPSFLHRTLQCMVLFSGGGGGGSGRHAVEDSTLYLMLLPSFLSMKTLPCHPTATMCGGEDWLNYLEMVRVTTFDGR